MRKDWGRKASIFIALLAGIAAPVGWVLHIPELVRIRSNWPAMDVATTLCLLLGGLALAYPKRWKGKGTTRSICGAALIALGSVALSIYLTTRASVDWHWISVGVSTHLAPMAPNAGLGFFLVGIALPIAGSVRLGLLHLALSLGAIAIGATGLLGYVLRFELLYSWESSARMSIQAALGLTALGTTLLLVARRELPPDPAREEDGRGILAVVSAAITIISVVIALGAVAFMLNRIDRMTTDDLRRQYQDRSQYFTSAILQGITRAGTIAGKADAATQLRALATTQTSANARAKLNEMAQGYLTQGFTWVAFERNGQRIGEAGSALQQTEMEATLYQRENRKLLWRDGFYLRLRLPVSDEQGPVGEVVTEQPLDNLTSLLASIEEWGETSEMLLCTLNDAPFHCFPARSQRTPFTSPREVDGSPLPMALALTGAGVASTRDMHGHSVIAAYGPIGNSGLGMVLKIDLAELYAPIHKQLQYLLVTLVLAIGAIRWLVQRRLRPLVTQLVESRHAAQINEARFLSAAESNLDAYYILESVRESGGDITDFRFKFVNGNGARLMQGVNQGQFLDQCMSALFPLARQEGFFDKYKQVAETGEALTEEVQATAPNVNASWLSQQVVKLGDGLAITLRDITERKTAEEKLKFLAQNDTLTGLPNRALFIDRLKQAMARARRNDQTLAVLFMDVDHFKNINDTHGHAAGDELLRIFADRLRRSVRETDTAARLGGDEFTAILEEVLGADEVTTIADRFLASLRTPIKLATTEVTITSSIGIALYVKTDGELSVEALLERADEALYGAKHGGRNQYALYSSSPE